MLFFSCPKNIISKKGKVRELKNLYETAKIDVILLSESDVITTSGDESIGTGGSNMSGDGWTPVEW